MKHISLYFASLCVLLAVSATAQSDLSVSGPDGKLKVEMSLNDGQIVYSLSYNDQQMIENSPLGLITNEGDFTSGMKFIESQTGEVNKVYTEQKIKQSFITYSANTLKCTYANADGKQLAVFFQVSDNDVAFRYELPAWEQTISCVVEKEITGFKFPISTHAFVSSMMRPMTGFARTAPSYESGYQVDVPLTETNAREGYVFPALFRVDNQGWVLLSETGVSSQYCASHLSNYQNGMYSVEYPNPDQNNGFGSSGAQVGLPAVTPWRTITVGETLKPVVETTIPFDVVEPLYKPSKHYQFGRGTWSWIIWQDNSMNYEDQVKYIDLAAALNFEYILIDAWWDRNIGYERMEELIRYAKSKDVEVFLWYNSNGSVNDAFQTPRNKMNTSISRKKEMEWLREVGVAGLKVDFFGGDKQVTMKLYEDILSDANDFGLMIFFHGATLPRGWEIMYPNFVGSEAVLASEMLVFVQDVREKEAEYASLHPFIRNTVASMEFGGVVLNDYFNKGNQRGQKRLTTNAFQLATGVLFQNPVQMFALTPNNLHDAPEFELDFMRNIPTTWDETVFIDGYPGKYCVLARRKGSNWYIAGVNAEGTEKKLTLNLPMLKGETVTLYYDDNKRVTKHRQAEVSTEGQVTVTMESGGGFVIYR